MASYQHSSNRLAAAALVSLALLVAAALSSSTASARNSSSHAGPLQRANLTPNRQPQDIGTTTDTQQGVRIDAFDKDICGMARFRPWQESQGAFDCLEARSPLGGPQEPINEIMSKEISPRIFGGERALEGEFPSYVHINITDKHGKACFSCGATLIDKNLVVTAAHCVAGGPHMKLVFGSNWLNGTGGEVREANKWCYPSAYTRRTLNSDLAIIRFDEPIEYVSEKIWPACVSLDSRHADDSICTYAGLGRIGLGDSTILPDYLKTLTVKRNCVSNAKRSSCYMANEDETHRARKGDSGSPVYCYDRCSSSDDRVQAFAVATHSSKFDGAEGTQMRVSDFNLLRTEFMDLLKMIRREGIKSSNETICEVPSETSDKECDDDMRE